MTRALSLKMTFLALLAGCPTAAPAWGEGAGESWPGSRDGLVWIWENGASENHAPPLAGEDEPFPGLGQFEGRARLGPNFEQLLERGSFVATAEAGRRIVRACRETGAITVEALVTGFDASPAKDGRILTLGKSGDVPNFSLSQSAGGQLTFRLRTAVFELAKLENDRPAHVLVAHRQDSTACWIDGQPVPLTPEIRGDFQAWDADAELVLGGENWNGSIEAVAIFNRFLDDAEARSHQQLLAPRLNSRQPIPATEVEAELVQITPAPPVEALESYRRALVENVFEIREFLSGPKIEAKRIVVLQWAILDRKPLGADPKPGSVARLRLEPAHLHRELRGEFRVRDHAEFDAPVFLDVGSHLR